MHSLSVGVAAAVVAGGLGFWIGTSRMRAPARVVAEFHKLYHARGEHTFNNTWWMGAATQQCPLDLWVFQEIIHETKPDVLVETGTFKGGSAGYYASLFDLLGHGRVITVDIEEYPNRPQHPRISYLIGSSKAAETLARIKDLIRAGERVMVILDSAHERNHVLKELELYSGLVSPGLYLIVQDTHFNGHPILPKHGPGPWEAVTAFLESRPPFEVDRGREKFLLTFNPRGYLRRTN